MTKNNSSILRGEKNLVRDFFRTTYGKVFGMLLMLSVGVYLAFMVISVSVLAYYEGNAQEIPAAWDLVNMAFYYFYYPAQFISDGIFNSLLWISDGVIVGILAGLFAFIFSLVGPALIYSLPVWGAIYGVQRFKGVNVKIKN